MNYRNDVDGIRALAVVLILFFHAELPNVAGGFIGVDIFFVISGYLITGLIADDLRQQRFRLREFFVRRIFRLAPALLATIVITLIAGWFVLPPGLYTETAFASLAALFSASNVYFWWNTGYFDTIASQKPLLHTWSLGVEAQFYLLWPVFFVAIYRSARTKWVLAILTFLFVSSLLVSQKMLSYDASAAFYLTPFRVFEFTLGAGLAVSQLKSPSKIVSEVCSFAAIALIFYAASQFNPEMNFPGFSALLPCVAVALLIYAGPTSGMNRALSLPPIKYIGKISYSLYLIHWPVQVFYGLTAGRPEETTDILLLLAINIVLAATIYQFIESPLRLKRFPQRQTTGKIRTSFVSGSAVTATVLSSLIIWQGGFPKRIPDEIMNLAHSLEIAEIERHDGVRDWTCNATTATNDSYFTDFQRCQPLEAEKFVVVLGDSHAADIYMGIQSLYPNLAIVQLTGNGCHLGKDIEVAGFCTPFFTFWRDWMLQNQDRIAFIIYGQSGASLITRKSGGVSRPDPEILTRLVNNLHRFVPANVPLHVWGPRPRFNPTLDIAIMQSKTIDEVTHFYPIQLFETERSLDLWFSAHLTGPSTTYHSSIEQLCDIYCPSLTVENEPFVIDYAHWSPAGAVEAVKRMIEGDSNLRNAISHLSRAGQ
ncbi:acyltransferase family protein [Loktanella sp. S4079]|uniref:acyltransferase family protein n=1 Tax=Loktanella sp. S4079 TaxID=579483 RepID=UPI0005FA1505|nr:acyltransferase family protein [Loktanella sp. S4079]KJZ19947.1 hypothetical protein TW80_03555 [Loktanella sp. S4079]